MYKKITLFALLLSTIGLILGFYRDYDSLLFSILDYISYNISTGREFLWFEGNWLRLFFSFFLFVGGIAYYVSKEKETRLLRFIFSVLFVEHCFFLLIRLYHVFNYIKNAAVKDILISLGSLAVTLFMLYFLYKSMQYLNKLKELDYETFVYTESTEISYFETNKWQRLLHLIIDSAVFGLMGFQFLDLLMRVPFFHQILENFGTQFSQQVTFAIIVFVFRTLFYFVFEALYNATPAKFLTESRVADYEGLKPTASGIFKRTLSRSIPLDSLSFLFKADWHDSISETQVYKEKKTGIKGGYYFMLFPLAVFLIYTATLWEEKQEKDRYHEAAQRTFEENKAIILDALKVIDSNTVLQLKSGRYDGRTKFLKADKISNASIEFSILNLNENESFNPSLLENKFTVAKDSLDKVTLTKTDLLKMILSKYEESPNYYEDDKETFDGLIRVPQLEGRFIEDIIRLKSPNLVVSDSNFDTTGFYVELKNNGIPAEIIAISSDDKKVNWSSNIFPMRFFDYGGLIIRGTGKNLTGFKFRITLNDKLNQKSIYEISSSENPTTTQLRIIKL
ncbi:RDD family protein [Flavobacterium sp. MR2016-29]|uniref:RDD family protein n=1 Tax=Flavobacterium sp. MR2016-29 TaxID=2783795 RepID=UPI00188C196F|nr:RDD family protein [Flavobacterium sp. MR2016-29]MBF4493839.1 RDD family protein [Flavobacterium sp. MR2016-29]